MPHKLYPMLQGLNDCYRAIMNDYLRVIGSGRIEDAWDDYLWESLGALRIIYLGIRKSFTIIFN